MGFLKLNFDGASKGNPGLGGFGCVIQNSCGHVVRVICGPLEECDSIKAETLGLLMGLRELNKMNVHGTIVEGDSSSVISWGKGSREGAWRLANFVYEIRELSVQLDIKYIHVLRELNVMADKLASWGVGGASVLIGVSFHLGLSRKAVLATVVVY